MLSPLVTPLSQLRAPHSEKLSCVHTHSGHCHRCAVAAAHTYVDMAATRYHEVIGLEQRQLKRGAFSAREVLETHTHSCNEQVRHHVFTCHAAAFFLSPSPACVTGSGAPELAADTRRAYLSTGHARSTLNDIAASSRRPFPAKTLR